MSAVNHTTTTTTTPAAVTDVLATPKQDPALERVLSFLRPSEVVEARRVNKKFNAISHESRSIRGQVNVARRTQEYINGQGRYERFSEPRVTFRVENPYPIISRRSLNQLAKRLEQRGNHASYKIGDDIGVSLYMINPNWSEKGFKPTEIIAMIPKKEIAGLYKHMWTIIGCPQKARAGEKAFHDKDGMHSTPAQKAKAIRLFLEDEAMKYFAAQQNEKPDGKAQK